MSYFGEDGIYILTADLYINKEEFNIYVGSSSQVLVLTADDEGITLPGNLEIEGDLTLNGSLNFAGSASFGSIGSSVLPSINLGYALGSSAFGWASLYASRHYLGDNLNSEKFYVNTDGVTTVAVTIAQIPGIIALHTAYCVIVGRDTPAGTAEFIDVVAIAPGGSPVTITSTTLQGSPAARTYTLSVFELQLAMASGTYNIGTHITTLPRN